jgi:hypothetical protein
MTGHHI